VRKHAMRSLGRALLVGTILGSSIPGFAQQVFRCGSTIQDRPCASEDVQKRFSHTSGSFSVDQVNADTNKACADGAAAMMPYWQRLKNGESLESLKAEFDAKPISREEKSQMRDALNILKEHAGTAREVRSQFEAQCMANQRRRGTQSGRAAADTSANPSARSDTTAARAAAAANRAAAAAARAAAASAR